MRVSGHAEGLGFVFSDEDDLLGIDLDGCYRERAMSAADENAYRRALRAAKRQAIRCAGCGAVFKPSRSNRRYHSAACKQKAYRSRLA